MNKAPSLETLDAPAELKALKQWLCWRFEPSADPEITKPLKMPYYAKSGRRRRVQNTDLDRAQLVTFEEARAAAIKGGYTGVGLAFVKGCPVTGLDFDHCIKDGAIDPQVLAAVEGTYAEISPSGTGVRSFVLAGLGNSKDRQQAGADAFGFELYNTTGFVTFTGNALPQVLVDGDRVGPPNAALSALCAERFTRHVNYAAYEGSDEPTQGLTDQQLQQLLAQRDPSCGYHEWKDVGMALHHETQGDGLWLWDEWSANGATYPGPDAMAAKWASFGQRGGKLITAGSLLKYAREQGHDFDAVSGEDFKDLTEGEPKSPKTNPFPITTSAQARLIKRENRWFIEDFFPLARLGVMFGATGSGKSFAALDMACAIARGIEWNGHHVEKGRVLYVVAEGQEDFLDRHEAYCQFHGLDSVEGFDLMIDETPNLIDKTQVSAMVESMVAHGGYALVVLDTFAQVTDGMDENSTEGMKAALAQCKRIFHQCGAMVLLVHHTGKDASKGARGSSALPAAADMIIEVSSANDVSRLALQKLKGGAKGLAYDFKLNTFGIGTNARGKTIMSCVTQYLRAGEGKKIGDGKNERLLIETLADLGGGIAKKDLARAAAGSGATTDRVNNLGKAIEVMRAKNYLFEEGGLLYVCEPAKDADL